MSLPEFPTISPPLTRDDAINQIISSIAMEELALSHIINAEGEKLQFILGTIPGMTGPEPTIEQILEVNESVRAVLQAAAENQAALRVKLQNALSASTMRGPAGPPGPAGPANGLNAFAGRYNGGVARSIAMTPNVPTVIELPFTTPSKNTSYAIPNTITISEAGAYYISFDMLPIFEQAATLTFAVQSNGVNIPATENTVQSIANYPVWYMSHTIANLPAGAVIRLAVTSNVAQTMSFDEESSEILNILKLD